MERGNLQIIQGSIQTCFILALFEAVKWFKILSEKSKNLFVQLEMKSQESIEITNSFALSFYRSKHSNTYCL